MWAFRCVYTAHCFGNIALQRTVLVLCALCMLATSISLSLSLPFFLSFLLWIRLLYIDCIDAVCFVSLYLNVNLSLVQLIIHIFRIPCIWLFLGSVVIVTFWGRRVRALVLKCWKAPNQHSIHRTFSTMWQQYYGQTKNITPGNSLRNKFINYNDFRWRFVPVHHLFHATHSSPFCYHSLHFHQFFIAGVYNQRKACINMGAQILPFKSKMHNQQITLHVIAATACGWNPFFYIWFLKTYFISWVS